MSHNRLVIPLTVPPPISLEHTQDDRIYEKPIPASLYPIPYSYSPCLLFQSILSL
jgi:hypothetical protein